MQLFSRVCAKLNCKFADCFPSHENLKTFIHQLLVEELPDVHVALDEEDDEISINGSWDDVDKVRGVLHGCLSEKLMEKESTINQTVDETAKLPLETSTSTYHVNDSTVEQNNLSRLDQDDCLHIEVIHHDKVDSGKDTKYSCNLCSFKSQRESHYLKHVKLHQTMSTVFCCKECNFSTCSMTRLRRHQLVHSDHTLTCSSCSYSTDDPKLLARHQRIKHKTVDTPSESEPVRQCPACPYQTTRVYLYQRHMKAHSAEESKGGSNVFICNQCDYRTSRKMHFLRHVKDVHRQWRPYLCHHCGKAFKRPDALKQHSVLHASSGATDCKVEHFQCRPCGKVCRSRAHLKEHQAVHSSERSFLCEICGAAFKTRSVQRKHASLHNNPRAFPCPLCNKRFNTNYALRRHMKQHQSAGEQDQLLTTNTMISLPEAHQPASEGAAQLAVKLDGQVDDSDLTFLSDRISEA